MLRKLWLVGFMVLIAGVPAWKGRAAEVQLASGGTPRLNVVVGTEAEDRVRDAAQTLAQQLQRITGGEFAITTGDGTSGLAVGTAGDFPRLDLGLDFEPDQPTRREEYLLRSHPRGVWLVGATPLAVEHAVWDLLHRLGYRQFFPGPAWEVVPERADLAIEVDSLERPDFFTRRIWYGHGMWGYNNEPYSRWCARNRAVAGFKLRTSHSYQAIIRRNKEVFDAHPEYRGLVDGKRKGNKLCISNPALRKFVVEHYALPYFRNHPGADCVSLEPSDGGGWCECDRCRAMGSISDRALLLANQAARAIVEDRAPRFAGRDGMMATQILDAAYETSRREAWLEVR
jgi:hypothetical protein